MPTGGRKPTSPDLSEILVGLLQSGVDFILIGDLAAVIQGAPVTTMDVDIVRQTAPARTQRNSAATGGEKWPYVDPRYLETYIV